MANKVHLARLKRGVEVWNTWRAKNRGILPSLDEADLCDTDLDDVDLYAADLSGAKLCRANLLKANLSRTDLSKANLEEAYLDEADLDEANLCQADLSRADLSEANLCKAKLRKTSLQGANLNRADLSNADLCGADLIEAYLFETELGGANFSGAQMGWTTLADVDLSMVQGLDTVEHAGPSTVGIDTLYRSHGNIAKVFLRGAGIPEDFIPHIKSLVGRPLEFYSCFISYSHTDKSFARHLYDQLQGRGIRCYLDEHQMLPGDDIYEEIDRGIRLWDKVLLCCSQASLTSWWVDNEINKAFEVEQA
jgi:hypothetical protein